MIGLAGAMTGYNGTFKFEKPGDTYREPADYMGMRFMCACFGAALIPLAFGTILKMTRCLPAAILAAVLLLLDTGTLTLTTFILLDPLLLFFIMLSTFSIQSFLALHDRPFSFEWWFWLTATGISLACSIGVKFVGLFVILLAGYTTAQNLYDLLCDLSLSIKTIFIHLSSRIVCLIVVPVMLYMAIFAIHFSVLNQSGPGDGSFSAGFQIHLNGSRLHNASLPEVVAFGSQLTIKQCRIGGAYLHSHWHLYPKGFGPRQQQVTTYSHKDSNNLWLIKKADVNPKENEHAHLVKNGDLIRLEHVVTRRNLHSHKDRAPLTKIHQHVSCYGENGTGDMNDVFKLTVLNSAPKDVLNAITHRFQLIHMGTGCALQSHPKQLPKWGWEQMEVTCNPSTKHKLTEWFVEEVMDNRLPNVSVQRHASSFLGRFLESHKVMTHGNSGLKPKDHEVTSRPWMWPIVYKGQFFSGKEPKVYMMGNPIIWWLNLATIPLFIAMNIINACRRQRGNYDAEPYQELTDKLFGACRWLLMGWAIHYLPFWTMSRVLYYHHYFPAHMYSCMLTAICLHYLIVTFQRLLPLNADFVYHGFYGSIVAGRIGFLSGPAWPGGLCYVDGN